MAGNVLQDSKVIAPKLSGDGSSQNLFFEIVGKGEKAIILAAAFIAVAICAYTLSRVQSMADNLADYKRTSEHEAQQQAEMYRLQTENLARSYQLQTEALKTSYSNLERQYRMTELILDDWNVTARRAGLKLRGDYAHGPQGNPDAESFNMKFKTGDKSK